MTESRENNLKRPKTILEINNLGDGLKRKALAGASFAVIAQTASYGIQTVGTIILARLLAPEDFGLVSMAATFSLLFQNFGGNGLSEAIIQKKDLTDDQMKKIFWTNFLIMMGLTFIFLVLSPALAWFFREPQLKKISSGMALSIIFSGLGTCHMALLSRNMKFNLTAAAQVIAAIISSGLGIISALEGFGFWSLVLRRVSLPCITSVFSWLFCSWKPGIPKKGTTIKPIMVFGVRIYGNFLLGYIRNNLDKILVGKAFGKSTLGHYDRASQLSSVLPNQLSVGLSGVGVATLCRLAEDPLRFRSYLSKALTILAFLGFPGSVLFTLLGKDMIFVLLGDRWSVAGEVFAGLGPGIGAFVIYNTNVWLHVSLGRADRLLRWGIMVLGISVAAYFLGLQFGPLGVAIAYSAMFYVLLIPALWYAGKPAGIKANFYVSILWKYWVAAFSAGLFYWIVFNLFDKSAEVYQGMAPLLRIFLGSIFYSIIYLFAIFALFRDLQPVRLASSLTKEMFNR